MKPLVFNPNDFYDKDKRAETQLARFINSLLTAEAAALLAQKMFDKWYAENIKNKANTVDGMSADHLVMD